MSEPDENLKLYKKFNFRDWSLLTKGSSSELKQEDLERLRGFGETISLEEVDKTYLPLIHLLSFYINNCNSLNTKIGKFFDFSNKRVPFIIGVAGSVAAGKSTFSRIFKSLLEQHFSEFNTELVTTDGFLYSNQFLEEHNLMDKKGFPESYDTKALFDFLSQIKEGKKEILAPVYSHLLYDVVPSESLVVKSPDIVILEGINVLQSPQKKEKKTPPIISDFFDFSIYIDADEKSLRHWYVERFLSLRSSAFKEKGAFFNRFSSIDDDEAKKVANSIWEKINLKNLHENILPTKYRADLILKKDINHKVNEIWLRNI